MDTQREPTSSPHRGVGEPSRVPLRRIALIVLILAAGSGYFVGALALPLDAELPYPGWVRAILVSGDVLVALGVAALVFDVAKRLRLSGGPTPAKSLWSARRASSLPSVTWLRRHPDGEPSPTAHRRRTNYHRIVQQRYKERD